MATGKTASAMSMTAGREFAALKWLMTLVPPLAVYAYETVRHELLEHLIPTGWGNLLVGLLVLALAYAFTTWIFAIVGRLQLQVLARGGQVAALEATAEERERLGRELHDGLAQLVAYLLVRLDTVSTLIATERRTEAQTELERLRGVADDLYTDLREAIAGLRCRVNERGLAAALVDYAAQFEERFGLVVDCDLAAVPPDLSPTVGLDLFRITQEALANARKHAAAHRTWIVATRPAADTMCLTVGDDGQGFEVALPHRSRGSLGLATMRERAEGLGGALAIDSQPGVGTRVVVTVPLVVPEREERRAAVPLGVG